MKKIIFLFTAVVLLTSCSKKLTTHYEYVSTIVEVGAQGTAVIKAWGEGKSIDAAKADAQRNAVYSLLFKGFPSADGVNSTDLRPMVTDPNALEKHKSYFDKFFDDGGKYLQYVRFADNDGRVGIGDAVHTQNGHKVAVVVIVDKRALRSEMENAGIISKFGIN